MKLLVIGYGWQLKARIIDTNTKQVWFTLYNNGVQLDDVTKNQGDIYTYISPSVLEETNVPLFVTYIQNITKNTTTNVVTFKYTWALSKNFFKVSVGEKSGKFTVVVADRDRIVNKNIDYAINLCRGCNIDIIETVGGAAGIRVADKLS